MPVAAVHSAIRVAQERHARAHAAGRRGWIAVKELLAEFLPGSHGPGWAWADETRQLLSFPCLCPSDPPETFVECDTPGHYQLMLEDYLREAGGVEQPICLGTDGRVWDGHHRVVAAMRLGFDRLPVENSNAAAPAPAAAAPRPSCREAPAVDAGHRAGRRG